ncbi:MAG: hypothetical protein KDE47_22470 [Caldilineaceae bacterium]|nr:hypothetical protein [Caldilineaceae bacterium]
MADFVADILTQTNNIYPTFTDGRCYQAIINAAQHGQAEVKEKNMP